jgi:hypothetical protein
MTNPTRRALPGLLVMTAGAALAALAALPPVRALAASSPLVAVAQCFAIAIVVTGLDSVMPRKRDANVRLVENAGPIATVSVRANADRRSAAA